MCDQNALRALVYGLVRAQAVHRTRAAEGPIYQDHLPRTQLVVRVRSPLACFSLSESGDYPLSESGDYITLLYITW